MGIYGTSINKYVCPDPIWKPVSQVVRLRSPGGSDCRYSQVVGLRENTILYYYTMLYYTMLYYAILYYTILYTSSPGGSDCRYSRPGSKEPAGCRCIHTRVCICMYVYIYIYIYIYTHIYISLSLSLSISLSLYIYIYMYVYTHLFI